LSSRESISSDHGKSGIACILDSFVNGHFSLQLIFLPISLSLPIYQENTRPNMVKKIIIIRSIFAGSISINDRTRSASHDSSLPIRFIRSVD